MPKPTLGFDIEANGRREVYLDKKNKQVVIDPEVTEVHCICIRQFGTNKVWRYVSSPASLDIKTHGTLEQGVAHLRRAGVLVAHNGIDYDLPVLRRLVCPDWDWENDGPPVIDTLVWSRFLYSDAKNHPNLKWMKGVSNANPNNLDVWGRRLKILKGEYTGGWERLTTSMLQYCCQDTIVLEALYRFLAPKMEAWKVHSRFEHAVSRIVSGQIENGVSFNVGWGEEFWKLLVSESARLTDELRHAIPARIETMKTPIHYVSTVDGSTFVTIKEAKENGYNRAYLEAGPLRTREHPFNPDSDKQVYTYLMDKHGWDPIDYTEKSDTFPDGQPKVSEDVLAGLEWPEAQLINECRLVNMRIGMLRDWLTRIEHSRDGRIHGSVISNGTPTTRMTHRQPNITQVTKVIFVDGEPQRLYLGRYGWESRRLFGPRPGWVQVGADADGLELRTLANRTYPFDDGAYAEILLAGDVHTHNLNSIPVLSTRPQAKESFYAGNYGAGDRKQGKTIATHKSLSPEQRAMYLKKYGTKRGFTDAAYMSIGREFKAQLREGCPALGQAIERCQQAARTKGYLILLDGRRAPCRSEHSALNTQLQGDGSVICKLALVLAYQKMEQAFGRHGGAWALMISAHDEQQFECTEDIAEDLGGMMTWGYAAAGERLGMSLPTPGSYKVGANWAECH